MEEEEEEKDVEEDEEEEEEEEVDGGEVRSSMFCNFCSSGPGVNVGPNCFN